MMDLMTLNATPSFQVQSTDERGDGNKEVESWLHFEIQILRTQKLFFTLQSNLKAVRENQAHLSSTILKMSLLNAAITMLKL